MAKAAGVEVQPDRWLSTKLSDDVSVHVRIDRRDGQLVVTDLMVSAPDVTTDVLRELHPGRLLAAVAQAKVGPAGRGMSGRSYLSQISMGDREIHDDASLTLGALRRRASQVVSPVDRELLGRPDGQADFYERVADAYRSASAESGRPAVLLATENRVPVETVRRWVKESRRRGFLEPGGKGRAI